MHPNALKTPYIHVLDLPQLYCLHHPSTIGECVRPPALEGGGDGGFYNEFEQTQYTVFWIASVTRVVLKGLSTGGQ